MSVDEPEDGAGQRDEVEADGQSDTSATSAPFDPHWLVWLLGMGAVLSFLYGQFVQPDPERVFETRLCLPFLYSIYAGALAVLLWLASPGRIPPLEAALDDPVCPQCLGPYHEGAHFCPRCAAPVTAFAATAGYEHIYAQAWVLGRAGHGPSRPIHAVALGLLIAPVFLALAALLLSQLEEASAADWAMLPALLPEFGLALIYLAFFLRCLAHQQAPTYEAAVEQDWPPYGSPPYWSYDLGWGSAGVRDAADDPGPGPER